MLRRLRCWLAVVSTIICYHLSNASVPCNYQDTINITLGHLDQEGQFHYDGMVFKKGMFAEYDYTIEKNTEIVKVQPHFRGCICELRPCIRLCCAEESCISDTLVVPTHEEDEEIDVKGKTYGVLTGRPCEQMYKLDPQEYSDDIWYFVVSPSYLKIEMFLKYNT